jgi:hypothetical protein
VADGGEPDIQDAEPGNGQGNYGAAREDGGEGFELLGDGGYRIISDQ